MTRKLPSFSLPQVESVEDLRRAIVLEMASLLAALRAGSGPLDAQRERIINLSRPVTPTDAATKEYVDGKVSLPAAAGREASSSPSLAAAASGNLTLTAAYQDVPGAALTISKTGTWLLLATFHAKCEQGDTIDGIINDGSDVTSPLVHIALTAAAGSFVEGCYTQTFLRYLSSGQVVKLRGKQTGAGAADTLFSPSTTLTAAWVRSGQ